MFRGGKKVRKTKIVCTLGPASTTYEQIKAMALAGMNVARINMSHGSYEEHQVKVDNVKKVREELSIPLPIMVDLKGPEVRIGTFEEGKIDVVEGMTLIFTNQDIIGNNERVSITYKDLYKDVKVGDTLLLNDGLLVFKITDIRDGDIYAEAQNSGVLSNRKGLFVPNVKLNMPFLSDVDKRDLDFAIKINAEMVAASFVQDAQSMIDIRNYLESKKANPVSLIAKIGLIFSNPPRAAAKGVKRPPRFKCCRSSGNKSVSVE